MLKTAIKFVLLGDWKIPFLFATEIEKRLFEYFWPTKSIKYFWPLLQQLCQCPLQQSIFKNVICVGWWIYLFPNIPTIIVNFFHEDPAGIFSFIFCWTFQWTTDVFNKGKVLDKGEWHGLTVSVEDCHSKGRGFKSPRLHFFFGKWSVENVVKREERNREVWRT